MKTKHRIIPTTIVSLLCVLSIHSLAIEDLKISVNCPDFVLSWPSVEGETYIVQYRPDLSTNSAWVTLTNNYPAAAGTNVTAFVQANMAACSQGQSFSLTDDAGFLSASTAMTSSTSPVTEIMAIPANGAGGAAPLALYPPGFDLSNFIIF